MGHYAPMPRGRWVLASGWGVGIAHSFAVRKSYLRRIDMLDDPALQAARAARERQAYARQLAQRDPQLAREAGIGRSGGFTSLEDLGMTMDLPGDVVEDLRGRLVFLPR